jgi:hypothetical protein
MNSPEVLQESIDAGHDALLETDQAYCYDADGNVIPCGGTGQDASRPKRKGAAGGLAPGGQAAARFDILGDAVHDRWTGAIWTRKANAADFPLTWDEARAFAAAMAARDGPGLTGWRLPPRRLLFSLVSHQQTTPALPEGHPFREVFSGCYWTADACSRLPEQAWQVDVGGGRVRKARKSDGALVWPVRLPESAPAWQRGESALAARRFVLEGEGVLDTATQLVWRRDADPARRRLSWPEALAQAAALARADPQDGGGWRLPNIRELESLVDLAADSPALPPGHPFVNLPDVCWSSTTSVYEPRYAWALYTRDGMVGVGFKAQSSFSLWLVRDKQGNR